jgi:LAS superfamily LD-carboxypeptidase LdcB
MREEAAKKLSEMAEKFYTDMGEKMVAVSTYRSYGGLAVDFWSASTKSYWDNSERLTKFYNWLYENAHLYGYHNTYQNGLEIDGYEIEPWHWRYV